MINISARKTTFLLTLMVVGMSLAHLATQFARLILNRGQIFGLTKIFNLGEETTIPTWYATVTLLICAILLAIIAQTKKQLGDQYTMHWFVLALIFLLLSLDEAASLHDLMNAPAKNLVDSGGLFYFAWVIPGLGFVLIVALAYSKFILALPTKIRWLFIAAGITFVTGSIGIEMVSGYLLDLQGWELMYDNSAGWLGMSYAILVTLEEFLEMSGIVIFIYALLTYLSCEFKDVTIHIKEK